MDLVVSVPEFSKLLCLFLRTYNRINWDVSVEHM